MFSLKVLGGAVLEGPAGQVTGRAAQKRRLALLAALGVARRPVGRERLIFLLWPDHPADNARHLLSEALYVLRKALGDDALVSAGDEVALNPRAVACDAADFESALEAGELERAASLYRGALLDGFYVGEAGEFDRWADAERTRLARAYARAVDALAERADAEGRAAEAVEWWRRLAAHDPYSSRAALRLLLALEAAGEHAAALRFAAAHAEFLREEEAVEPGEEFVAEVERIRQKYAPPPEPPAALPDGPTLPPPASRLDLRPGPAPVVPFDRGCPADPGGAASSPGDEGASGASTLVLAEPDLVEPDPDEVAARKEVTATLAVPGHVVAAPPAPAAASSAPRPRRRGWTDGLAYHGGMVGMLAGLMLAALTVPRVQLPSYDPRRIAVLYFDDNSPGGDHGYLAEGLTGGLIDRLGEVGPLDVISRNGVKPYRGGTVRLDSVVADLKVGSVVEGSVQRSGDRLRVTVSLIDANTRALLESRTIEAPMGELFALEDSVAHEVAGFLRRRLGEEIRLRARSAETRSVAARELVFRAEQERARAEALKDTAAARRRLAAADSLLARASAADPRWAAPWVVRGWVRIASARLVPDPREGYREAVGYAGRALALSPELPAALELRGAARLRIARRDGLSAAALDTLIRAAERDLRDAVEAEPSRAVAWSTLSQLLRQRGKLEEADEAGERALEEDAWLESPEMILERRYFSKLSLARLDSAAAWCARGAREFPASWRFVDCQLTLMGTNGGPPIDVDAAWRLVERADRLDPPARARDERRGYFPIYRRMAVARVLARAGEADSARAVVARARDAAGNDTVPLLYDRAVVHVLLGEYDAALDVLERFARNRPRLHGYLAVDVMLRPLHGHRRFRALVTPGSTGGPADRAAR